MGIDEKRDIKRKLNVINYAKQIGNVKRRAGIMASPDPFFMFGWRSTSCTEK